MRFAFALALAGCIGEPHQNALEKLDAEWTAPRAPDCNLRRVVINEGPCPGGHLGGCAHADTFTIFLDRSRILGGGCYDDEVDAAILHNARHILLWCSTGDVDSHHHDLGWRN